MNLEIGEVLMRSVNWLIIGFVVIILAASIIYSSLSYNNLSVIVETNGSNTDVNYNSILSSSLPPVMVNEIKNKALEDVDSANSTVYTVKVDINSIDHTKLYLGKEMKYREHLEGQRIQCIPVSNTEIKFKN